MFIGRKKEFEVLDNLYNSNKFEMLVLYGRRRIGKTTLLTEFCKDKRHIFFSAQQVNAVQNLQKISSLVNQCFNQQYSGPFSSFEDALNFICSNIDNSQRFLIAIDDFPYLVNSNKSVPSILQNIIDHKLKNMNIMLVLCGSSIAFMEDKVLGSKSPLFGRRTYHMELSEFNIFEVKKMFPAYTPEEIVLLYSAASGTPQYLTQFDKSLSVKQNLIRNLLTPGCYLFTEPVDLIRQELRDITIYNTVLLAIAGGASRFNEIVTASHEKNDKIANYLKVLQRLRIVKKLNPITEKINSKKSIYRITDNLFRFHYRYIIPMKEQLEEGNSEMVYNVIMKNISDYIGYIFEDICQQFIKRLNRHNMLPIFYERLGKWWGTDKRTKSQSEIDVMAMSSDGAIFAECKYTKELIEDKVLDNLIYKSGNFDFANNYYFLFSKNGFKDSVVNRAKKNTNIFLFDLERIFLS